jgi:hypothetical protein
MTNHNYDNRSPEELFLLLNPNWGPGTKINYGRMLQTLELLAVDKKVNPNSYPEKILIASTLCRKLGEIVGAAVEDNNESWLELRIAQAMLNAFLLGSS